MPSLEDERAIVLRRFEGTNILLDSAYLGPAYLKSSQNWIPSDAFRLTKAPGTLPYPGGNIPGAQRVQALRRCYSQDGVHRYLYAVVTPTSLVNDQLWVSVDDGLWSQVLATGGGTTSFLTRGARYGMDDMNGVLYVGNGMPGAGGPTWDPIITVPLGGSSTRLVPLTMFTDASAPAQVAQDPTFNNQILSGTYSYCWCIFDHDQSLWVERGQTRFFTVDLQDPGAGFNAAQAASIVFPLPTGFTSNAGVVSARFQAHLFISPVNLPIELAHDQITEGITSPTMGSPPVPTTTTIRSITADPAAPVLPTGSTLFTRIGRIFRWHGGRLWFTGDTQNPTAVWATSALVPGLEQQIFNAGLYFPQNARTPRAPDPVTALGTCMTTEDANPDAPMAITTLSRTFLFYGDILDDPGAEFMQISRKAGCINDQTMVETAFGLFYCGLRSIYMIPVGGGVPQDVGWPIRPAIEQIPPAGRALCTARYHKGFYKLAIVPPGSDTAIQQWWLDLRRGLGQIPSWWGPHLRAPISAWTTCDQDPQEPDRAIHAIDGLPKNVVATTTPGSTATVIHITPTPPGPSGAFAPGDVITIGGTPAVLASVDSSIQLTLRAPLAGGAPAAGLAVLDTQASAIELIHQLNTFTENGGMNPIISLLASGELDDGKPFVRKNFTRVRVTAFPAATTQLATTIIVDGAAQQPMDPMSFTLPGGAVATWNVSQWNVAQWGVETETFKLEGESLMGDPQGLGERPRGESIIVLLTHSHSMGISIRDFEVRYLPVPRVSRSIAEDGST